MVLSVVYVSTMLIEFTYEKGADMDKQTRFNWGYRNAEILGGRKASWRPGASHFDKVYVAGWMAAEADMADGTYGDSNRAWAAYRAEAKAKTASRKCLPDNYARVA
jgi:hypothetical protein